MACDTLAQSIRRDLAGLPAGPCLAAFLIVGCAPVLAEAPSPSAPRGLFATTDEAPAAAPAPIVTGATARPAQLDQPARGSLPYAPPVREGLGVSFLSVGWTKEWRCAVCPKGLTTNMTAGFATPEAAAQFLSDIQYVFQAPRSGIARPRQPTDDLIEQSLANLFSGQPKHQNEDVKKVLSNSFVRGAAGGGSSLNKYLFDRPGVRRLSLPLDVGLAEHLSLMGRVNQREQFWSLSYRYEGLKIEVWNHLYYRTTDPYNQTNMGVGLAYSVSWNSAYPFK